MVYYDIHDFDDYEVEDEYWARGLDKGYYLKIGQLYRSFVADDDEAFKKNLKKFFLETIDEYLVNK